MRFDDRLLTVLTQPAADERDLAVRWRQLVDLVARAGANAAGPAVEQALESIRRDASNVDEPFRTAAARAVSVLPLPLSLLEYFVSDQLSVSSPVLAAATLDPEQWRALLRHADEETRDFVATLHPEVREGAARSEMTEQLVETAPLQDPPLDLIETLAPPEENEPAAEEAFETATDQPTGTPAAPSLHEVVERIERRRRTRWARQHLVGFSPPAETAPGLFRWETGPGGEIAWVEGAPRGALIGRSIARAQPGGATELDPQVVRAFTLRAPFRDAALMFAGEGPLAGEWKISGVPAFEPTDGRFAGYRGIALREESAPSESSSVPEILSDPDSVRELVHEIKTPLNAIIGFAEIIDGQFLGPAEEPYRDRARQIVRQARLLLTAIDDLDFAARIHSSPAEGRARVNLIQLVDRVTPALRDLAVERGAELRLACAATEATAAAEPELADRLIYRMCSAIIEQAGKGELLDLAVDRSGDRWRVSITRPADLSDLADEELMSPSADFEQGFSLRLVSGLARIAGADLVAPQGSIALLFRRA